MEKVIIRIANDLDIKSLSEMYLTMYDKLSSYGLPYRINEETIEEVLGVQLKARTSRCLVAEEDGKLIGFIFGDVMRMDRKLSYDENNIIGHIKDIYVDDKFGRCGLGTELLAEAEKWMLDSGATIIECNVMIGNQPAQKFWDNSNYEVMGKIYFKKISSEEDICGFLR